MQIKRERTEIELQARDQVVSAAQVWYADDRTAAKEPDDEVLQDVADESLDNLRQSVKALNACRGKVYQVVD